MGRKKNPENKTRVEDIREKLESSRQNYSAPLASLHELSARDAFSEFWARVRKEYNRPRDLESVIWAHLKSSGHDQPHLFEAGLAHFGLRK
jgi:hypothetical protein